MVYYIAFIIIGIGLYGIVSNKNLFKQLISLSLINTGVNIFIIALGYLQGLEAPIYSVFTQTAQFVDPLPQALVLTAIVIGVGILALGSVLLIRLHEKYGTVDAEEIRAAKEVIE